jgi:hypothetical protein
MSSSLTADVPWCQAPSRISFRGSLLVSFYICLYLRFALSYTCFFVLIAESRGEVRFPEIPGVILEKVIQYMHYKVRYANSTQRIPNFNIEPEISMELLMAASYLDC